MNTSQRTTEKIMQQPTIQELQTAWTICIELEGIAGAQSQAKIDLRRIRDRKHTWVGKQENELRFAIDRYLSACVCSDGPFHYDTCPLYDADKPNPFEQLGKALTK